MFVCAFFAGFGAFLILQALGENKQFFRNPSDLVTGKFVQDEQLVKIGGLVVEGSVVRSEGLNISFQVKDITGDENTERAVNVVYNKILPDLFREGQGIVVTGRLGSDGVFRASEVLAKHDENYRPKMPAKMSEY